MNTKKCVGRSSKYTCFTNISTNKENKCTANLLLERNFVLLKITFKFGYMPQNWTEVQLCYYQSTMAIQIRIICIKMVWVWVWDVGKGNVTKSDQLFLCCQIKAWPFLLIETISFNVVQSVCCNQFFHRKSKLLQLICPRALCIVMVYWWRQIGLEKISHLKMQSLFFVWNPSQILTRERQEKWCFTALSNQKNLDACQKIALSYTHR